MCKGQKIECYLVLGQLLVNRKWLRTISHIVIAAHHKKDAGNKVNICGLVHSGSEPIYIVYVEFGLGVGTKL